MAAGGKNLVRRNSTLTKLQKGFLTCSICYDIYDVPKCLPCLHTFCKDCLSSYIQSREDYGAKRKKGFACPVCRQFVFVKSWEKPISQWAHEMQNNFMIQDMIDSLLSKTEEEIPNSGSTSHPEVNKPLPTAPPLVVDNRARPTAPPEQPETDWSWLNPLRAPIRIDTPSEPNDWDAHISGSRFALQNRQSGVDGVFPPVRHSQSTLNVSPDVTSHISATNPFRNRSNSQNDMTFDPRPIIFADPAVEWRIFVTARRMKQDQQISDVCCLPNSKYLIATDYANCAVLIYTHVFLNNKPHSLKVNGRPCSVAVVDEVRELIVVNLQDKSLMVFIEVPSFEILQEVQTSWNYRSVASVSPYVIIAGSNVYPARIDQLELDVNCSIKRKINLFQNESNRWHLSDPRHLSTVFNDSFFVSDAGKRCILCFDIIQDGGVSKAVKRYSISPRGDRKITSPGGLFLYKNTGNVYTVDYGSNTVLHIVPDDTVRIETLLTDVDGIQWPASVCMGPGPDPILCVADWEGNITLFNQ